MLDLTPAERRGLLFLFQGLRDKFAGGTRWERAIAAAYAMSTGVVAEINAETLRGAQQAFKAPTRGGRED